MPVETKFTNMILNFILLLQKAGHFIPDACEEHHYFYLNLLFIGDSYWIQFLVTEKYFK